jgi:hypothetical protein
VDVLDYAMMIVTVYSDEASATDGLEIQQSDDNINWDLSDCYTISAGASKTFSVQRSKQYFRVKYTNGGAEQGAFRLNTLLSKTMTKSSSHRVSDAIVDDDDAELVTNVNKAKQDDGTYTNIGATNNGNLKVANVEDGFSIAQGLVAGVTSIHKFGESGALALNVETDVWDYSATEEIYTFSTSADIDTVSSSSGSDTVDVLISGLDENWNEVDQIKTLTGQTKAVLNTSLIRVYRIKNLGATDLVGSVYVYPDTTISTGVPVDTTKVRAYCFDGNNQTLMAIMPVPASKTAYLTKWFCTLSGKTTAIINVRLYYRPFGGVFQLKESIAISGTGSSAYTYKYETPLQFEAKGDFIVTADSNSNNAVCSAGFDLRFVDD